MQDMWGSVSQTSDDVVDTSEHSRRSAVVKTYPDNAKRCTGVITDDTTGEDHRFHVRYLSNGCEDMLTPQAKVTYAFNFSELYGMQPVDITLVDVMEEHGVLLEYNPLTATGIIKATDSDQRFHLEFDAIVYLIPGRFTPGLRVTFNTACNLPANLPSSFQANGLRVATNVRFEDPPPCLGMIKFFKDALKFGFIKHDGGGKDVWFAEQSVVNLGEVRVESRGEPWWKDARVTYHLERVRRVDREKHGEKGSRATEVRLQHATQSTIQEVRHAEPPAATGHNEDIFPEQNNTGNIADETLGQEVGQSIYSVEEDRAGSLHTSADSQDAWTEVDVETESDFAMWEEPRVPPRSSDYGDVVYLVKFTRCGKVLEDALHKGRELETVRAAAADAHQSCKLRSGASIFVYPNQYQSIMCTLSDADLRPHHVLVSEAFLPLIYLELTKLPSRANVRPGRSQPYALVDHDGETICLVERCFFNSPRWQMRNPRSVAQSSSEVHHITNHRRRIVGDIA